MDNKPYFSIGPLVTGQQDLQQLQAGQLQPWLKYGPGAAAGGTLPAAINRTTDYGIGMMDPLPQLTPAENLGRKIVGMTAAAPGAAMRATGNFLAPTIQNTAEAFTKPEGEIAQTEATAAQQQQFAQNTAADTADVKDLQRTQAFDAITGGLTGESEPYVIGPAESKKPGYTLPMPPGPTDYSRVQEAIDKTKPVLDEQGLDDRRKGAILVGLIGGLLSGAMDGNANAGEILARGGQGVLLGVTAAAADKVRAQEKFKDAVDQYWVRTAGVRQNEAESSASYANRVYETKVRQLAINAEAEAAKIAANATKVNYEGGKLIVESTDGQGQRTIRAVDLDSVNRMAGMQREVTRMLGGTDEAKKKAGAIVAEVAARKDPAYALPMVTVARMKENGTYLDLVKKIGEANPDWLKSFNSIGAELSGVADQTQVNKLSENRRDAMLIDLIMRNPAARQFALGLAGLDEQRVNDRTQTRRQGH